MDMKRRKRVWSYGLTVMSTALVLCGFSGFQTAEQTSLGKEFLLGKSFSRLDLDSVKNVECVVVEKYAVSLSDRTTQSIPLTVSRVEETPAETEALEEIEEETLPEIVEEEKTPLQELFETGVMVDPTKVSDNLNVRSLPGLDGEIIGKLYPDCGGVVLEVENGWVEIESGKVNGWVSEDYLLFGDDAAERAEEVGEYRVIVESKSLNIRREQSADSEIVDFALEGDQFPYVSGADEDWVQLQYNDEIQAYVASEYVSVEFIYPQALTLEEDQARIAEELRRIAEEEAAARKAEADRQAAEKIAAAQQTAAFTNRPAITVSYDEACLMAAVVWIEAGNECYEGKLAVANVILNRLKQGWADSITGVIFAPGQFYGNDNGLIQSYAANPNSACLQAVYDACAGSNNVGNFVYFNSASKANLASYPAYAWIGNQCFH